MLRSCRKSIIGMWALLFGALLFSAPQLRAQDGTYNGYSPYSVYGVGDLFQQGSSTTRMMGGIGTALRNQRLMNLQNPAAVTARDTLSFMADFSISASNTLYEQGSITSAHNTFNISSLAMSFPIWRSSALMLGLTPYSNVGYDFSSTVTDPELVGRVENIGYNCSGNGSIYKFFISGGVTFWEKLSVGAEFQYYFGNIEKATMLSFDQTAHRDISTGYTLSLHTSSLKLGAQYETRLPGNMALTAGATYQFKSRMSGYIDDYRIANVSSLTDTLRYQTDTLAGKGIRMPGEFSIGLALKKGDKWLAEIDYTQSDWTGSGFDAQPGLANKGTLPFAASVSRQIRGGFELTPNRYDTRYYLRRVTYRGGAYYNQAYYQVGGNTINAYGLTFGITLPINRYYNGLSLGVDIGQRGSTASHLVRETYVTFNIGFNIHDIWFRKYRYE